MTALVFALQPDQVCVAMDTLVVGAEDKQPVYFQRKFIALPEMNLLIAGTGLANLINDWFSLVRSLIEVTDIEVTDIDELNDLAPSELSALASTYFGSYVTTTTLYHFGYSKGEGQYVGYAYRSTDGFEPDRLQYALGYKPVIPIAPTDDIRFPDFLIEIILEQQRQDLLLPVEEQVGVGGEIEFAVLSEGAIHVETVHRFASYEAELKYIVQHAEA